MKTFLFKTVTTENSSDFWINSDVVRNFKVQANNLSEAKKKYFDFVSDTACITISKTQQKHARKMYVDNKEGEAVQTGYVFVGSLDVDFNYQYKRRFVSLWCTISEVVNAF